MHFPQYAKAPTKWQKYLLLAEHGLLSLEELESGIRRRTWKDRDNFHLELNRRLAKDQNRGEQAFYVVKLVPQIQEGQLPNLRIRSYEDVRQLDDFFQEHKNESFEEVWCCRTVIDQSAMSTAGRIVFVEDGSQIVEHVSRCSPRMIELFDAKNFAWPFIEASRVGWGRHFKHDITHIPSSFDRSEAMTEFRTTMQYFETARESISAFCDFLEGYRFSAYSLEYKCVGNWFRIIDWDTCNDLRVLG